MADEPRTIPKDEAIKVVHRAGYPHEVTDALEELLPDPVDLDRDQALLDRFGLTADALVDRLGGSP